MDILAAAIICMVPFHAFLTVWGSSVFGHYTELRLWKEFLLLVLVCAAGYALVRQLSGRRGVRISDVRDQPLSIAIGLYLILLVLSGILALATDIATPKAMLFGLLLDARFLIFFAVVWVLASHSRWLADHWRRLLLYPATAVLLFGLLQFFVLPPDFLRHFGYGPDTIVAIQTVDQKLEYQRAQSTLRGANPLGAYLIIIIAASAALMLGRRSTPGRHTWWAGLLAAALAVLALTFSRSAWLGAFAALAWLLWQAIRNPKSRQVLLAAGAVAVLVAGSVGYGLRNNDTFQNTFFHTDEHSQSPTSSNQGHREATVSGVRDIVRQPLGGGTGTAGPASVYNDKPARIAENYFVQVGQEAGIIGLLLLAAIHVFVGRELWRRRAHPLARTLLVSLIGIVVVNMLSHAWTDDTLAYVWWGLAGAAMGLPLTKAADEESRTRS
jgi:hypothetical protein